MSKSSENEMVTSVVDPVVPVISVCPSTPVLASFPCAAPYDPLNEMNSEKSPTSILQPPRMRHKYSSLENSSASSDLSIQCSSACSSPASSLQVVKSSAKHISSDACSCCSSENNTLLSRSASACSSGATNGGQVKERCRRRRKNVLWIPPPLIIPDKINSFCREAAAEHIETTQRRATMIPLPRCYKKQICSTGNLSRRTSYRRSRVQQSHSDNDSIKYLTSLFEQKLTTQILSLLSDFYASSFNLINADICDQKSSQLDPRQIMRASLLRVLAKLAEAD